MKMKSRPSFVLGFAAAIGGVLALGTVALARPHSSPRMVASATSATGAPSPAPLAILSHVRDARDNLPASLVASVADLAGSVALAPEVRNGTALVASSHLALADLGGPNSNSALYVVPTSKGRGCVVFTNGPHGCDTTDFTAARPGTWEMFDVDGYRYGSPTRVDGLVPNNVDRVTVIDDRGGRTDARLANNAYYLELSNPDAMPKEVVLNFADGGSASIEVPRITVGVAPAR